MSNSTVNVTFPWGTLLFVVFLVLKLTDTIDWSWWWVTAPLWIPLALIIAAMLIILLAVIVSSIIDRY